MLGICGGELSKRLNVDRTAGFTVSGPCGRCLQQAGPPKHPPCCLQDPHPFQVTAASPMGGVPQALLGTLCPLQASGGVFVCGCAG